MDRLAYLLLWGLVFTVPWTDMAMFDSFGTISRIIGMPAFAMCMMSTLAKGQWRFHAAHFVALAFVALAGISYFWSIDTEATVMKIITYAQLLLLFWVIFQSADTVIRVENLLGAFVLGAGVAAGFTLYSYAQGVELAYQRYSAGDMNPNDLAYALVMAIPMAWYLRLRQTRDWLTWVGNLYVPLGLFAVFLTASRGGAVVAFMVLSYIVLRFDDLKRTEKILFPLVASIMIVMMVANLPQTAIARIATIGSELTAGDMNSRSTIWSAGLQIVNQHWFLGAGSGSFEAGVTKYLGYAMAPHNAYIAILAENGVVGLLLFLGIVLIVGMVIWRLPRGERYLWGLLLLTWGIASFVSNWEWRKETWVLFGMALAHAAAVTAVPGRRHLHGLGTHMREGLCERM